MRIAGSSVSVTAVVAATALSVSMAGAAIAAAPQPPSWHLVASAGAATFRSIAPVSRSTVWLGSDSGTVVRTTDGGRAWADVSPSDTAGLHVRAINAWDARHAVAMTAGPGRASRVYLTSNGGGSWVMTFQAQNPSAFFDDMAFADAQHGLIVGDPIDGKFHVLRTSDGGAHWITLPRSGMPPAQPDEYGFADSGTTVSYLGHDAWFGSGGSVSRVWHSADDGLTWDVTPVPIQHGSPNGTAGVYGLAFRTRYSALVVGGNFLVPNRTSGVAARLVDGIWRSPADPPGGTRFAAAWIPASPATAISVGINGSDVTIDGGRVWTQFDDRAFNTVGCAPDGGCWAGGNTGDVAKLRH
jgi:photosystem II stability/assembly factor-like uncharacterized protein